MKTSLVRKLAPLTAIPLLFGACGSETEPGNHTGQATQIDIFSRGNVKTIAPGETAFSGIITDTVAIESIVTDIDITDYQYPGSWNDTDAPTVGQTPIRVDAHQAFSSEGKAGFSNDVSCDSIQVNLEGLDPTNVYVGAVALSESKGDEALIVWPRDEGTTRSNILVCMDDSNEPSDGVVLFVSDRPR